MMLVKMMFKFKGEKKTSNGTLQVSEGTKGYTMNEWEGCGEDQQ